MEKMVVDIAQLAQIVLAISAVLVPVLLTLHRANLARFTRLEVQLNHQDTCLDDLRGSVNEAVVKHATEARGFVLRTDLEIELSRIRAAIRNDIASNTQLIQKVASDLAETRVKLGEVSAVQAVNVKRIADILAKDNS